MVRLQFGIVHKPAYAYDPARNVAQQKEATLRGLGLTQRGRQVETKIKPKVVTSVCWCCYAMLFTNIHM